MQKLFYSRTSAPSNQQDEQAYRSYIKSSIDSLLKQDIQLLQHFQSYQEAPMKRLKLIKNNELIREYVHSNYDQYQINDPLPHMAKKHQRYKTQFDNSSGQAYESVKVRPQAQRKVIKLESHRTKHKMKTEPYQESTKYRTATDYDERSEDVPKKKIIGIKRSPNKSTGERLQTGYSTISPANQKYLTNEFSIEEERSQFDNLQVLSSRIASNPFSYGSAENNQRRAEESRHEPISQTFRYCVGCEKPILEANISYHENVCRTFQNIIELPLSQTLPIIDKKIISFENSIEEHSKKIPLNDNFIQLCQNLVIESKMCRKKGSVCSRNFYETQKTIENSFESSTVLLESISKLNWFMKIRQNIAKNVQ